MQVFVLRQNVDRYRKLLATETDQQTRERLQGLLKEAEAQLRQHESKLTSEEDEAQKRQESCKG